MKIQKQNQQVEIKKQQFIAETNRRKTQKNQERANSAFNAPPENINSSKFKKYRNYFAKQLSRSSIYRWDKRELFYYVDKATRRRLNISKVRRAMSHWERKTSGLFLFRETNNLNNADIYISLASTSDKSRLGEAGPSKAIKGDILTINGGNYQELLIKEAKIVLSDSFFDISAVENYKNQNRDMGFLTLVHELGHVLGIIEHSPNNQDCMYWQADRDGVACNALTADANTLKILYGRPELMKSTSYDNQYNIIR